ncbi:MAG: FeoB-associated Cys-rich membrane protein [Clostridia bacterium]|nr:FeoB-associated Cys-rich membrane protein [Clostridia bacterium]
MLSNIIVGLIVLVMLGFAVRSYLRGKKKGGCGCMCQGRCESCSLKEENKN